MIKLINIGLFYLFLTQLTEYNFNHRLIYEVTDLKNHKKNHHVIYLINEQDNSYFASQKKLSSYQNEVTFLDQKGIYWKGQINNEELNKSKISLKKEEISNYRNPYKHQVNHYNFIELRDTILNNKVLKRFMLKSNEFETKKNKKLGTEVYVIDTSFSMNPLFTFATAYEIWKAKKNIPNGLIMEKYFFNSNHELITKEILKSNESINLTFSLPSE